MLKEESKGVREHFDGIMGPLGSLFDKSKELGDRVCGLQKDIAQIEDNIKAVDER